MRRFTNIGFRLILFLFLLSLLLGLDTHRMTEILLMGGVPVIRQSTISSCYDDTDNVIGDGLRRVGEKLSICRLCTIMYIYFCV